MDLNIKFFNNKNNNFESDRDYIKTLAHRAIDFQIIRNNNGNQTGMSGAHNTFPPFHWKCRTMTAILNYNNCYYSYYC